MKPNLDRKRYPVSAQAYDLLEEVGRGVSATVYKAKCVPLNEVVAIKALQLEKCNCNLDDVRREAQTMSLINHPNVLSAHCSFVVEQSLWVIMPYMGGGSWLHIMKSSYPDGFDEPVIATILRECLKGLEYLHSHGHIHRDVKAGNILVDANGAVKLGDFGVSACMFDSGDRQRSRTTFVGTPCWMAPEVMEQLHGYDFKADIWSFGITALELAHGHAPFSKYPPMKVLLMTLQNAPPGLDYERDKRFSKSFKEMIAVCLVKDPAKRPTAEKLLRHSFFKHARSNEYIARTILDGLPPLGQRLRDLELKDAVRLAQKMLPSAEEEERSQNEYKRGVSCWNFDVEDLKAQATLVQDDDKPHVTKEDFEHLHPRGSSVDTDVVAEVGYCEDQHDLSQSRKNVDMCNFERLHANYSHAGHETDVSEHIDRGELGTFLQSSILNCPEAPKFVPGSECLHKEEKEVVIKDEKFLQTLEGRNSRVERMLREGRRASSGPLLSEHVLASYRGQDEEKGEGRFVWQPTRGMDDLLCVRPQHQGQTFNGVKVLEKGFYVKKKGRFAVTCEDVDLVETFSQRSHGLHPPPVSAAAILPQLQNILQQSINQQELISDLINRIRQGEACHQNQPVSKLSSRSSLTSIGDSPVEVFSERECELLQKVAGLQNRMTSLVDELHAIKIRNVSCFRLPNVQTLLSAPDWQQERKEPVHLNCKGELLI
eukprot:c29280_g1_i1 orf=847-2979(+)